MYRLTTPLAAVKGIGPKLANAFVERELHTVKDLLLFVPIRYEDRSLRKTIAELVVDELVTIEAEVLLPKNFYKGRRSIQSATARDETGKVKLMWFNNPHVISRFFPGQKYLISGKLNDHRTITQPTVEKASPDSIHTGRLVPVYSALESVPPTTLRKLLKHVLDQLAEVSDPLAEFEDFRKQHVLGLRQTLQQVHFPDSVDHITQARERLALEELLLLIQHSHHLKAEWQKAGEARVIESKTDKTELPFALTTAQTRCVSEILNDIQHSTPMNRLLIGDVGSGKTAVAGLACEQVLANGFHAAFVCPTQILAEQHTATFQKLFPHLHVHVMTAKTKRGKEASVDTKLAITPQTPTLFIGTHAILHQLEKLKPALLIYDEQHRFGVHQRSMAQQLQPRPHILTLSATPIPRTLMLTIFAHLSLSHIDELPPGRKPVQSWVVPEKKRANAYQWMTEQLTAQQQQALIVCPFIDPSASEALENVAAATTMFEEVKKAFAKTSKVSSSDNMTIELLHGRVPKTHQSEITKRLYNREIDVLVTTPIIEVGVDLPAASIIVIEAAERFGLASLHQMRGRVGRAGQDAYCLLFTNATSTAAKQRLQHFCQTTNGLELAEQDLQRRGAGDIFGAQQHGFDNLRFANWTNVQLITTAKKISDQLSEHKITWQPLFNLSSATTESIPLAN